jgi:hypothetical protein
MPDFFNELASSEPPEPSEDVDQPCTTCPGNQPVTDMYKVVVGVFTRAGEIPIKGVQVTLNGALLGSTDAEGKTKESGLQSETEATIVVTYENASEGLKEETCALRITSIDAKSKAFTTGSAENKILKVQDVFGSGAGGFGGDLDFVDSYSASGDVAMSDTSEADVKLLAVVIRMATLSLQVPYLSQVGPGETIQIAPPTPANPAGQTHTFRGNIICMPTATKMAIDYWGITAAGGSDLSRNALMQECWDTHSNPQVNYPCPWQKWSHLRATTADLAESSDPGEYTVDTGPAGAGGNSASIPSTYADGITTELAAGKPVVTSTYATSGHVMCVRGAVVKNDGTAQWLILNDPYGNLASGDSIYDKLDISAPVGLRGNAVGPMNDPDDVRAVREVLHKLGHYSGPLDTDVDEADANDPTVIAIRAFQGGKRPDGRVDDGGRTERRLNSRLARGAKSTYSRTEGEANVAGDDNTKGRHVYYNGGTEAKGPGSSGRFRLKTQGWTLVIEKVSPLSKAEIRDRLVPHQ